MGKATLTPVIRIDEEKCVNCYACITSCPVKYCMDGSGEKLTINSDLCIGCGNCIAICTHNARLIVDNTDAFLLDLKRGVKMVAIAAPAVASFFPDKYLNLNGYLKSLGIDAVFDVSFGAELTVLSYLDHIKGNNPRLVIAQPCPAIVSFIEIYHPQLLNSLAPADSPMLHTIKMIREYFPQFKDHKVAIISPCVAKRREFDETALGNYNITLFSIRKHLEANKINISAFPAVEYFGPQAERAVGFSTPGGLLDTVERFVPGFRRRTHKSEGLHTIYPYLEEISKMLDTDAKLPLLVDCLNCEKGCNGGPGTGNGKVPLAKLENPIRERHHKLESYHEKEKGEWVYKKYLKEIKKYWKKGLYNRKYRDLSGNNSMRRPNEKELNAIYTSLKKHSAGDIYNCTSCGYGSCESMAYAIFNKLNKPENCLHYTLALLKEEMEAGVLNKRLVKHLERCADDIDGINKLVKNLSAGIDSEVDAVEESSRKTEHLVSALKKTSDISLSKQESIRGLIENAERGKGDMQETIQSVQGISLLMEGIGKAISIISSIAADTNLLAMNAAIEAVHAGNAGKGFAVVAGEIRRLSENTRQNSVVISKTLKSIVDAITVTTKQSSDTNDRISGMAVEINGFAETMTGMIKTLSDLSVESSEIINAFGDLKDNSYAVKKNYSQILTMTNNLSDSMVEINTLLSKND
jgi:iron only hydrogenase large subunit-like protein